MIDPCGHSAVISRSPDNKLMLSLRVFGGLSIENGGQPIVGAAAQRSRLLLLAVLAVSGEKEVSRERLHALLWPDSDFERARKALNQALFALRRDLSKEDLTLGSSTLRLNPAVINSDVGDFLRSLDAGDLSSAVNAYAGCLLDGIHFRASVEADEWIDQERGRLKQAYENALRKLAADAEAIGKHQVAIDLMRKLAASDPLSSTVAISLMNALAAGGDRAAALRHARIYAALVRDQLGIEGSPDVERLSQEIAAQTCEPSQVILPSTTASASVVRGPAQFVELSNQRVRSKRRLLAVGAAAFVAVGAATTGALAIARETAKPTGGSRDVNRVVVIPFQNRTGDASLDPLGSLGADWITDGLARTQLIPVVDPQTAAAAIRHVGVVTEPKADPLADIADMTGATNVVSGSFYRKGDSLEFNARVSDGKTGKVLGSIEPLAVPSARSGDGIQVVRQRMLSLLAQLFDARMTQLVMPDARPPSFEAYKEFVKGVDHWARDDVSREEQRGYFRRAYALDTTFLTALAFIPSTYDDTKDAKPILDSLESRRERLTPLDRIVIDYFRADLKGDYSAELAAAERASDLAPRSEWSWAAGSRLAALNRPHAALRYFARLDPNHGWMPQGWERYWYSVAQTKHTIGDLHGTRVWLEQARRKFPQAPAIAAAYARALALTGQPDSIRPIVTELLQSDVDWRVFYVHSILADLQRHGKDEEAEAIYQQVVPWYEAKGITATESDRCAFGRILFDMHMEAQATAQFRSLLADFPKSDWRTFYIGNLALLAGMRGDSATALRLIDMVPQKDTGNSYVDGTSYWRARVAAQLGHKEEAVRLLGRAFANGMFARRSLSHSMWYDFPTLQGYPPFESMVAQDR